MFKGYVHRHTVLLECTHTSPTLAPPQIPASQKFPRKCVFSPSYVAAPSPQGDSLCCTTTDYLLTKESQQCRQDRQETFKFSASMRCCHGGISESNFGDGGRLNRSISVLIFCHIIKIFIVMGKDGEGTFLTCTRNRPLVIKRNNHENETLEETRRIFSSHISSEFPGVFYWFQHAQ